MSTKQLSVVCAGTGNQGSKHRIPALLSLPEETGVVIPAVVDPAVERARAYLDSFANPETVETLRRRGYYVSDEAAAMIRGARVFARIEEALEHVDADAVMSVVPGSAKMAVGRAAAEAGAHLFTDKPTAPTAEEAEELVELFRSRGLALQDGYHLVSMVRPITNLVSEAKVEINRWKLTWVRADGIPGAEHFWADPATGGVTRDLGGHLAAIIKPLTGQDPVEVVEARVSNGRGRRLYGLRFRADDTSWALVRCSQGVQVEILVSWAIGSGPDEKLAVEGWGPDEVELEARLHANKHDEHRPNTVAYQPVLRLPNRPEGLLVGARPLSYVEAMVRGAAEFVARCRGMVTTAPNPALPDCTVAAWLASVRRGAPVRIG